jgi:glycolate oxidase FAD binding subunit
MSDEMIERVKHAAQTGSPLSIRGSGSKSFYGLPIKADTLDVRSHRGIISYEPTELVLQARCGTPLKEIEDLLAEKLQILPFEPPYFGPDATLGGCIAAGLAGPARASVGAVRDFVLGATLLNSNGDILKFGGQVMKNVAGYDVSRLLAGSLGTLGVILDVSLKILPKPQASVTQRIELNAEDALATMQGWRSRPLPISATFWHQQQLWVRLSGAASAVQAARQDVGGEVVDTNTADETWQSIREQTHEFFKGPAPLWRVALPAAAPLSEHFGFAMEWGGMQRWLRGDVSAAELRRQAAALGGHATLFRGSAEQRQHDGVFSALGPVQLRIQQQLKQRFDPKGIFNPKRMYPEF